MALLNALVDLDRIDEDHDDRVVLAVDGGVDGGELLAGVGLAVEHRRDPADLLGGFGRGARGAVAAFGEQRAGDDGEPLARNWLRSRRRTLPLARRRQRGLAAFCATATAAAASWLTRRQLGCRPRRAPARTGPRSPAVSSRSAFFPPLDKPDLFVPRVPPGPSTGAAARYMADAPKRPRARWSTGHDL